jgi:acetyl-CoA carboxylase biotin carboxylase subunit
MIRRVLVANRGEIACRVIRTCRQMGLRTIAVYSDVDHDAPHVHAADDDIAIGAAPASESYLNMAAVLGAARRADADAVHPGYGFLSENADFADACMQAGLVWIGPTPDVIRRLGSKTAARRAAVDAGVPVVPGELPASQDTSAVVAAVQRLGLPVLIKATAGGGGKGMRTVHAEADIIDSVEAARREATRAFGNGDLYVERLIAQARHVEVQIIGDHQGTVLHFFERDCSLQRRHQKVVEESPAWHLSPRVRDQITAAALAVARAVGYTNAGTVEFLVEGNGDDARFYFLEMNTRLQVEHPITEAVTGVDLVRLQLLVAASEPLPLRQDEIALDGHAIECRIYAEDSRRLLPQAGRLLRYREPSGPGLRVDSGVIEGQTVTVHYDPLLAKLIAHAPTREEALTSMQAALRSFEILGLHHNVGFLRRLLALPDVIEGLTDTRLIERRLEEINPPVRAAALNAAAALAVFLAGVDAPREGSLEAGAAPVVDPWDHLGQIRW